MEKSNKHPWVGKYFLIDNKLSICVETKSENGKLWFKLKDNNQWLLGENYRAMTPKGLESYILSQCNGNQIGSIDIVCDSVRIVFTDGSYITLEATFQSDIEIKSHSFFD
jgi:hypothetical protein